MITRIPNILSLQTRISLVRGCWSQWAGQMVKVWELMSPGLLPMLELKRGVLRLVSFPMFLSEYKNL